MEIPVYQLYEKDIPQFRQLIDVFGKVFDDPESYHAQQPTDSYLQAFLAANSHIVIVAEYEGRVIGGLVAYVLTKFEQARREIYLYDLAVVHDMQRRGIGRRLMDTLRHIGKAMDAYVVFVQADEGDDAISFYRALGPATETAVRNFDFDV